jgi:hypothetical protein
MGVRETPPGVTVFGVVLSDGPPLAFCEVRAPAAPVGLAKEVLLEAMVFWGFRFHAEGGGMEPRVVIKRKSCAKKNRPNVFPRPGGF